jgi:hypothetical protein
LNGAEGLEGAMNLDLRELETLLYQIQAMVGDVGARWTQATGYCIKYKRLNLERVEGG